MFLSVIASRTLPRYALRTVSVAPLVAQMALTRAFASGAPSALKKETKTTSKATATTAKSPTTRSKSPFAKKGAAKTTATKKKAPVKKTASKGGVGTKKAAKKPTRIKLRAVDKPPKRPLNSYGLFYQRYLKSVTLDESDKRASLLQACADASKAWHALTEHEKQAFADESAVLFQQYHKDRTAYFAQVDPRIMRELNRRRAEKGKRRIISHKPHGTPLTSFLRFLAEFRQSPEATEYMGPAPQSCARISSAAGEKWRAMSTEEQQPYRDGYLQDKENFEANKTA